jgi:hypothetical protein
MTDTLIISEATGVQHKNLLELVRSYIDDLQEFGRVAFQTQPFATEGGMQTREVAVLNEEQTTLLITYNGSLNAAKFLPYFFAPNHSHNRRTTHLLDYAPCQIFTKLLPKTMQK